jgi:phosphonate transport system substrate-binding protein
MNLLKFTSCQAATADATCRAIVAYLGQRLGISTQFVDDVPWQERSRLFDAGEIQVSWICGWPYVRRVDREKRPIELLVAPVMQGARYQGRPVYFSDVVVRRDSPYRCFADLRGVRWAYNEPESFSGSWVVRYHLATLGEMVGYFGAVVESGAHQDSLQMILNGEVAAAAIDSTVLETILQLEPALSEQINIVATLGPNPMPPWVIHTGVEPTLRQRLRTLLTSMHEDLSGQAILNRDGMAFFAAADNTDYDPIREMVRHGASVTL